MIIKIDASVYDEGIIHKTVYWFGKDYTFRITRQDRFFLIEFIKKNRELFTEEEEYTLEQEFLQSLVDNKTRSTILSETKNVRDLIILKAFFQFSDEEIDFDNILNDK